MLTISDFRQAEIVIRMRRHCENAASTLLLNFHRYREPMFDFLSGGHFLVPYILADILEVIWREKVQLSRSTFARSTGRSTAPVPFRKLPALPTPSSARWRNQ